MGGGAYAATGAAVIGPEHVGRRVRHETGIVGVLAMGRGLGLHVLSLQGPGLPEWDDGTNWASDPADGWTLEPPAHDVHAAGWTDAAAKDQGQRAARVPVITVLSQNPPAALLVLGPGVEIPEEVHEADELLLLVRGRVVVRTTVETRFDPDGSAFSFRIGRGVAHSLRAGADGAVLVAVMLPAAAAEVQHPDGDPFTSAPWSKARARFIEAVDEVTIWVRDRETQVPNTPGRETAERRLVDAAAGLLRAAGYAVGTERYDEMLGERNALRDQLATAEAATEQARAERDAAERDRAVLRSRVAALEVDVEYFRDQRHADTAPGRTWVERAEARLVALEQAPTLARVAAVEAEVLTMRERIDALERETASLRYRLDQQTPTLEWALYTNRKIEALERRTAAMPDALSEACHEIAAETGAPVPDPTPTAEPRAGEVWEDSDDGEQVRLVQKRGRGELHDRVEVIGATVPRDVYPPRWRRISEQTATAEPDRGTLPRMPEQTGIVEPPVPHRPAEQMQEAIVKMLRGLADDEDDAERATYLEAARRIEAGEHLAFIEPPVPHRSGA